MIDNFTDFALALLLISALVFVTLLPLIVWTFCQEAPRPSWQLAVVFVLCLLFLPVGVLFVIIYVLNIIITHKAKIRSKRESLDSERAPSEPPN